MPQNFVKTQKSYKFLKIAIFLVIILLILLVSGLVSLFASTGEQSYASAILDSFGQHKLALTADMLRKNPDVVSRFATLNPQSNCSNIWTQNMNPQPIYAASVKTSVSIMPVSREYQDDFRIVNTVQTGFDLQKSTASFNWQQNSTLNFTMLEEATSNPLTYNPGIVTTSSSISGVANSDGLYILPEYVSVKNAEESAQDSLSTWYGEPSNFTSTQKEGVSELAQTAKTVLALNPAQMISADSGQKLMKLSCDTINSINVSAIENVQLPNSNTTMRARKVTVETKTNSQEIISQQLPDITEQIVNEGVLKEFLKGQYDVVKKASIASAKIEEATNPQSQAPTMEEYNKAIDDLFKDFDKEALKQRLDDAKNTQKDEYSSDYQQPFTIQSSPTVYYVDHKNTTLLAATKKTIVTFSDEALQNFESGLVKNILEKGIEVDIWNSDIQTNQQVTIKEAPSNFTSIDRIEADTEQTNTYKLLEKWIEKNTPTQNAPSTQTSNTSQEI